MAKPDWRGDRLWEFRADMNADGLITISDVGLWFKWLYFYPGDGLIAVIGPTALGQFFELSTGSFGGFGSAVISFFGWIIGFSIVVSSVASGFSLLSDIAGRLSRSRKQDDAAAAKSERIAKGYGD